MNPLKMYFPLKWGDSIAMLFTGGYISGTSEKIEGFL